MEDRFGAVGKGDYGLEVQLRVSVGGRERGVDLLLCPTSSEQMGAEQRGDKCPVHHNRSSLRETVLGGATLHLPTPGLVSPSPRAEAAHWSHPRSWPSCRVWGAGRWVLIVILSLFLHV